MGLFNCKGRKGKGSFYWSVLGLGCQPSAVATRPRDEADQPVLGPNPARVDRHAQVGLVCHNSPVFVETVITKALPGLPVKGME